VDAVDIVSKSRDNIKKIDQSPKRLEEVRRTCHICIFDFMRVVGLVAQSKPVPLSCTYTVTPAPDIPSYPQLRQLT
jgi:hypothetical protein